MCTECTQMGFEWDKNKAEKNLAKHGIDFADTATVFEDYNAITIDDPYYTRNVISQLAWMLTVAYLSLSMPGEEQISG
jgi:uncharacterized DUF497 family protein